MESVIKTFQSIGSSISDLINQSSADKLINIQFTAMNIIVSKLKKNKNVRTYVSNSINEIKTTKNTTGSYLVTFNSLKNDSYYLNKPFGHIFAIFQYDNNSNKIYGSKNIVYACYILYNTKTIMVTANHVRLSLLSYSSDKTIWETEIEDLKEFCSSHQIIKKYSINESLQREWLDYFLHQFLGKIRETHTLFFVDNIVADFHTALLTNGVYINTATQRSKDGDVHLATEAIPLTYIMSRIGGLSHDGKVNIQTKPFPTSRNISRKTSFISCSSKNMNLLLDILNPVLLTFD